MTKFNCSTCKSTVTNDAGAAVFSCPNCQSHQIVRCKHCREIASRYTCPGCQFSGPN